MTATIQTPNYLSAIQKKIAQPNFYVILYGPPGIGKTSLAARMTKGNKNSLFIIHPEEQGINDLKGHNEEEYENVGILPPVPNWKSVLSVCQWLATCPIEDLKEYDTIVFDGIGGFATQCFRDRCETFYKGDYDHPDNGFFAYGKGPISTATTAWGTFMNLLTQIRSRKNLVLICHSQDNMISNAIGSDYIQRTFAVNKWLIPEIHRTAQHIILLSQEIVTKKDNLKEYATSAARMLYCDSDPRHIAKSKGIPNLMMGNSPDETWSKIKPYLIKE